MGLRCRCTSFNRTPLHRSIKNRKKNSTRIHQNVFEHGGPDFPVFLFRLDITPYRRIPVRRQASQGPGWSFNTITLTFRIAFHANMKSASLNAQEEDTSEMYDHLRSAFLVVKHLRRLLWLESCRITSKFRNDKIDDFWVVCY